MNGRKHDGKQTNQQKGQQQGQRFVRDLNDTTGQDPADRKRQKQHLPDLLRVPAVVPWGEVKPIQYPGKTFPDHTGKEDHRRNDPEHVKKPGKPAGFLCPAGNRCHQHPEQSPVKPFRCLK